MELNWGGMGVCVTPCLEVGWDPRCDRFIGLKTVSIRFVLSEVWIIRVNGDGLTFVT